MSPDRSKLRSAGKAGKEAPPSGGWPPPAFRAVNATAELVADLLAATSLLSEDKLNSVRGAAGQGSIAQAIVDQGYAASEGVAKMLSARYHLPLVDLAVSAVTDEAAKAVPLHVLERLTAIPYELDGDTLRVAIADPSNVHAIDELRLATRHQVELSVASREDILAEIRRLSRASEAFGARAVLEEEAAALEEEEEEGDDLEADDGISDAPLVRLVNSIIFQAAEDGASDVHFEPQEDALAVRLRIDGVLQEVQRIPRRMMPGVLTRLKALAKITRPEINIITVEDPVEYRLGGVNQVQINQRAGLTFAAALRSILRSDPDVVMVGEIRDSETAKISIEAALTGHFVLSTLHTNDAPGALTRLNEMGVEPFLTGSAVTGVLAQRLARKLCTHCCEMYTPSVDELIKARVSPDVAAQADGMIFYRKKGCPRCNQTGYKGRIGIFQLLAMSETLETLAAEKASREELERAAMEEGMRTLWDDGIAKVAAGLTSIEELARVTI